MFLQLTVCLYRQKKLQMYKYCFLTSDLLQFNGFRNGIWRKIICIVKFTFFKERNKETLQFPLCQVKLMLSGNMC
jgi:hypothetical protein